MYQDLNLFIKGVWRPASDSNTKTVTDPATEDVLGNIAVATSKDVSSALNAAEDGFLHFCDQMFFSYNLSWRICDVWCLKFEKFAKAYEEIHIVCC